MYGVVAQQKAEQILVSGDGVRLRGKVHQGRLTREVVSALRCLAVPVMRRYLTQDWRIDVPRRLGTLANKDRRFLRLRGTKTAPVILRFGAGVPASMVTSWNNNLRRPAPVPEQGEEMPKSAKIGGGVMNTSLSNKKKGTPKVGKQPAKAGNARSLQGMSGSKRG